MTRTGDREIGVVSGRLPDNPGGLACMTLSMWFQAAECELIVKFNKQQLSDFSF